MGNSKPNPILNISSQKLRENLKLFKKISGNTEIGCVLKANAYGCGVQTVTEFLNKEGIKTFFFATHDEAKEALKFIKRKSVVYVLSDFWEPNKKYKGTEIISVISTEKQMKKILKKPRDINRTKLAFHLDCGLNRFGINNFEALKKTVEKVLKKNPSDILILAHLSHADCSKSRENIIQLNKLKEFQSEFPELRYSISGSAAVINNKVFSLDLVRPGISLFGGKSSDATGMKFFKNVVNLSAPVIQVKEIKKGEGVGYNHNFKALRKTYVATAKIGYADGLNRKLSSSLKVFYRKKIFKIIGKISMDLITFQVDKDFYENYQKNNHSIYVELINDQQSPNKISDYLGTIPHEVLTLISDRVKRKLVK